MATRTEARFGEISGLGTAYTSLGGPVPASHTWNTIIHIVGIASTSLRLYIADTSWSSAEPAGSTLKVRLAYDLAIAKGQILDFSGIVLNATEELVARAADAASIDISAHGVDIV